MDEKLIKLAIEALESRRTEIELEMEAIRIIMNERTPAAAPVPVNRPGGKRRARTPAEREAHSRRMKKIWAHRKAAAAANT